jgi:Family of unknown function (DUF5317)
VLVLVATALALLSARLLGGRPSLLVRVRLRASWVPLVALLMQVVILQVVQAGPRPLLVGIHILTYVMAAGFIWLNRSVPGLILIAAGAVFNGVTIALNDGTLPASASALAAAHIHKDPTVFLNSGKVAHPVLGFLGDVFAWPAPLPFANTFSVGDLLVVAGVTYGAHRISGSRLGRLLGPRSAAQAARAGTGAGDDAADPADAHVEAPAVSNQPSTWGMIEAQRPTTAGRRDDRS